MSDETDSLAVKVSMRDIYLEVQRQGKLLPTYNLTNTNARLVKLEKEKKERPGVPYRRIVCLSSCELFERYLIVIKNGVVALRPVP